jgi:hypothetical protein
MIDKLEVMQRLRDDGRWPEAEAFKNTTIKDLKAKGVKNAVDEAWAAMVAAFPPVQSNQFPLTEEWAGMPDQDKAQPSESIPEVDALWSSGDDPSSPNLVRDVLWAYANLENRKARPDSAPGRGAWSLLCWARNARNRFFEQLLPKALDARNHEPEEQQMIREEEIKIAEIEKMLEDMRPYTPQEAKEKVESFLDGWTARFAVTLLPEARKTLGDRMFAFREEWNGRDVTV